jgi:hypothetical protein
MTLAENKTIQPSLLLTNLEWVEFVINFLNLKRTAATTSKVSKGNKNRADLLLIKSREGFKSHVKQRVKQGSKQNHWILKFALKKLPIVATTMVLLNHLKIKLRCLGKTSCLLGCNPNQFIPSQAFPRQEGEYLYFDYNRGVFVRSGKVVRRGFQAKHSKHLVESKDDKSSITFTSCILQDMERDNTKGTS